MDLIDKENDVAVLLHIRQKALHAAFKLAPELGARHQGGEVQQVDLLALELGGNLPVRNPLGDALGDGGFAHARLPDEAGVIFSAPVEDLDHPVNLPVPAHNGVQLPVPGPLG